MGRKLERLVAERMMTDSSARFWGYELSKAVGASSGAIYPLLSRWYARGWLTDGWETREECGSRPPRRYYELSSTGARAMQRITAGSSAPAGSLSLVPGASR